MWNASSNRSVLQLPGELGSLIKCLGLPENLDDPIVVCEFIDGNRSLFDLRKGLFLSRPAGVELPSQATLKAFGVLIQLIRKNQGTQGSQQDTPAQKVGVREFAVCG